MYLCLGLFLTQERTLTWCSDSLNPRGRTTNPRETEYRKKGNRNCTRAGEEHQGRKEKWHGGQERTMDPKEEMDFFTLSTLLGVKLNMVETESRWKN